MTALFLLFIVLLTLWGVKYQRNDDFLSKDRCDSIKGIFILLILFSHSLGYLDASMYAYEGIDRVVPMYKKFMGQLVVVMFLFYSGYGVALQIGKRGKPYVDQMPRRRLLTTLLNFDVAVCVFILLNLLFSNPMTFSQIAMSMIAWDSLGNSSWYIFVILLCYLFTWLVAKLTDRRVGLWIFVSLGCAMLLLAMVKERYWYSTILSYPAGYVFACYKDTAVSWLKKYYIPLFVLLVLVFIATKMVPLGGAGKGIIHNLTAISFAILFVMLTMRVRIGNSCLAWCGAHLFPLYIYQRLPMMVMSETMGQEWLKTHALLFILVSLGVTCLIAYLYKYWQIKAA